MTSITDIVRGLHAKKTGNRWIACCPAHEDRTPSLSISERNGKVLVRCHAGCDQREVIDALRNRGLWPDRTRDLQRRHSTPDPDFAADLRRAEYWCISARLLADSCLEALPAGTGERYALTRLLQIVNGDNDTGLVSEYRAWRRSDPKFTGAMVWAGKRHDAQLQRRFFTWFLGGTNVW